MKMYHALHSQNKTKIVFIVKIKQKSEKKLVCRKV